MQVQGTDALDSPRESDESICRARAQVKSRSVDEAPQLHGNAPNSC